LLKSCWLLVLNIQGSTWAHMKLHLLPFRRFSSQGCTAGDTYSASVGKTTTVQGAFNLKVNVSLAQTSCTAQQGAAGTWSATATWPQISFTGELAVYPVAGGNIAVEVVSTVSNMVVKSKGFYSYTVNGSTQKLCVTGLNATQSSITVSDVSVSAGLDGATLVPLPEVSSKIESNITSAGSTITASLNSSLAKKVGKCKTVGTPFPPRAPRAPRPPRG